MSATNHVPATDSSTQNKPHDRLNAPLLKVEGLSKRFGGLVAVNGVSFNVQAGSIHSLIGPNGAGKTTLFNLITGAITPDSGEVTFDTEGITALAPEVLVKLGVVRTFQRTSIFHKMSALENIALAIRARRRLNRSLWLSRAQRDEINDEASSILEEIGLAAYADTLASALSHGNQRALDLAMGVALHPRLMLMDEPLAGMAQGDRERIARLILRLRKERGLTIIIVEHDIGMIMRLSDRITVMQHGKVLVEGTAEFIRESAAVKDAYLRGNFAT